MKMKNDHLYRNMGSFYFNGKHFVMFRDNTSKMAFLELDENNKFHYPELRDVLALTDIISKKELGVQSLIFDNAIKKIKKFKFTPKVKIAGVITLLSMALLTGCGKSDVHHHSTPLPGTDIYDYTYEEFLEYQANQDGELIITEDGPNISFDEEPEVSSTTPELDQDELTNKYLEFLSPADDEYDYKWANDYEESGTLGFVYAYDSSSYDRIFENANPTVQDVVSSINSNSNLSAEYKSFLIEFAQDFHEMYPDANLAVMNHNFKTLKMVTMTAEEIQRKTMSSGTVACYLNLENTICINENSNIFDKTSNDYVVAVHETLHAARTCKDKIDGKQISIRFYPNGDYGLYEDEVMATWIAYQMQTYNCPNISNKAIYYTLQSSIYRQFLPYMDYDGADYMNHSVNYMVEKMQDYFNEVGIDAQAYHIVNLIDSQAIMHYKSYIEPDYNNFSELYDVLSQNYNIQHANEYSSESLAFNNFWDDITFNFENLDNPYTEMTQDNYSNSFSNYYQQYTNNVSNIRK